jgi:adenosine kinase
MSFVITGSVAYDYLMFYPGLYREQILPDQLDKISLSFLAESMRKERGGVAANIAYTMKLLGADPIVFATVGQDFGDYRRWMEANGLRTDHVVEIPDEFTASFFVGSDQEHNQIAIFYTGAMAHARNYSLEARGLNDAQVVMISPNDPGAMLSYAQECRRIGIPYAYDPSQQIARLNGDELAASIPGAAYLLCNEYELAMVLNKTGWTLDDLRSKVAVLINTLGKDGSRIYIDHWKFMSRQRGSTNPLTRPAPATPIAAGCLLRCWPGCRGRSPGAWPRCAAPTRWSTAAPPRIISPPPTSPSAILPTLASSRVSIIYSAQLTVAPGAAAPRSHDGDDRIWRWWRTLLADDPVWSAYAIADLQPAMTPYCRWFAHTAVTVTPWCCSSTGWSRRHSSKGRSRRAGRCAFAGAAAHASLSERCAKSMFRSSRAGTTTTTAATCGAWVGGAKGEGEQGDREQSHSSPVTRHGRDGERGRQSPIS